MLYNKKGLRIFIYNELIDMRSGFERLHSYCVNGLGARMNQGHMYVFFGKNRRRMKMLWYDGTGLVLATKRMERGSFMRLSDLYNRSEITQKEFDLIFHGSVIRRPVLERAGLDLYKNDLTHGESLALPSGYLNTDFNVITP